MPVNYWWGVLGSGILIPTGIIVPFQDTIANIPTGWTVYDGSDRAVLGHTSVAGTTGGSNTVAITSTAGGNHQGPTNLVGYGSYTGSGSLNDNSDTYRGNHAHNLTLTFAPSRRLQVLMKATADHKKFPVNTGVLSDVTVAGATDVTPTGRTLYGSGSAGTYQNNNYNASLATSGYSSTGDHSHVVANKGTIVDQGNNTNYQGGGSHSTHGFTAGTMTDTQYRFWVGMWASATNELKAVPGVYGMWESSVAPKGWAICDGTNGTPDLSARFIGFDSGAAMGTLTGDGRVRLGGTMSSIGHAHNGGANYGSGRMMRHSSQEYHNHSASSTYHNWQSPFKTLIFIKAIG